MDGKTILTKLTCMEDGGGGGGGGKRCEKPQPVNGAVFQMMAESRRWEECRGLKRFC